MIQRGTFWYGEVSRQFTKMNVAADNASVGADPLFVGDRWPAPTTCFLCSRLGRPLEKHWRVFTALRTAVAQLPEGSTVIAAQGQTLHPFLVRLAAWYSFDLCELTWCSADQLEQVRHDRARRWLETNHRIRQWICLGESSGEETLSVDERLALLTDEIRALHVRPNGRVATALQQALARSPQQPHRARRVLILAGRENRSPTSTQAWIERGALPWLVWAEAEEREHGLESTGDGTGLPEVRTVDSIDPTQYLAHFVRGGWGPWADEPPDAYLDRLLFARQEQPRDSLAALTRVLLQQRLVAGNRMTRAATRVVCFTQRPITEFADCRKFQSHLGRWDFEPFGLAIEREYFRRLGGRPVRYGSDDDWESLPEPDRPFFQVATSRDGKHDWRAEREWRLLGDLDLHGLDRDRVIAFVPNAGAAATIQSICRFPIVALKPRSQQEA